MNGINEDNKKRIKDLTLLLIYLTSWEEVSRKEPVGVVQRAWRTYSFEVLSELEIENLIRQHTNSIIITREGIKKSEGLKRNYDKIKIT